MMPPNFLSALTSFEKDDMFRLFVPIVDKYDDYYDNYEEHEINMEDMFF